MRRISLPSIVCSVVLLAAACSSGDDGGAGADAAAGASGGVADAGGLDTAPGSDSAAQPADAHTITDGPLPVDGAPTSDTGAPDAPTVVLPDPRCASAAANALPGQGSEADPYVICLPQHLALLGMAPHGLDQNYVLGDDVNVAVLPSPLTTLTDPLTGSINGKGHRLEGLGAPLFATIGTTGRINNLSLSGSADATTAAVRWGLLANTNQGLVRNVHASGTFMMPSHAGILIGANEGTIDDCSATGAITSAGSHIGGLVGVNLATIRRSSSRASVTGSARVGGLVGRQSAPGVIEQSFALGKVSGSLSVGGLLGTMFGGEVRNCYARAESVTGPEAGGAIGHVDGSDPVTATIVNTYAKSPVSGMDAQGLVGQVRGTIVVTVTSAYFHDAAPGTVGTALSAQQMTAQASYAGWDFTNVWQLNPAISEYPVLRFQTTALR